MANTAAAAARGRVLRAWRCSQQISQQELASALHVDKSAVSLYESGGREIPRKLWADPSTPEHPTLADALGLEPPQHAVLVDMVSAAGSIGTPPRDRWSHNFVARTGAGWLWLRRPPGERGPITATFWWGDPINGRLDVPHAPAGVVVQLPTTVPHPPLQVTLDRPIWVDFGIGTMPGEVTDELGAQHIDGRLLLVDNPRSNPLTAAEAAHPELRPHLGSLRRIAEFHGVPWHLVRPHLGFWASRRPVQHTPAPDTDRRRPLGPRRTDVDGRVVAQANLSTEHIRGFREARGLSRPQAAEAATQLDVTRPVTARMVEQLENGQLPTVELLLARLDLVYGAEGTLGTDRVHDSTHLPGQHVHNVVFPRYWIGPVFITATGRTTADSGLVQLTWNLWRRRQTVVSGTSLTTRRCTEDDGELLVRAPVGWSVVAGTGAPPDAVDVNRTWYPESTRAAVTLLRRGIDDVRAAAAAAVAQLPTERPSRHQRGPLT